MTAERARILIVDDEAANVQVLAAALSDRYDLYVATSGQRALDLATRNKPDLVLLDAMMPGLDGFEVCRRLKADPGTRGIPVIFVTALGAVDDETRGFDAGGVDYITKPVSLPVVRARVRTHLELHTARERLLRQNEVLAENLELKEHVDRISRHDLRSPLSGIMGAAQFLAEDQGLGDEQRELARSVERACQRLMSMVNLSLGLFHMEKGTYRLQPVAIDLAALVRRAVDDLARHASSRRLTVTIGGSASNSALVHGEEVLCYSTLANLLKNAIEAAPEDTGVTVRLSTDKTMVRVVIQNQGAVPEVIRPRFFEKYASGGKAGGTGLGTYSARLMTETQAGRISMRTSDESGTAVEVLLPAAPPELAAGESDRTTTAAALAVHHVLLAEGEEP